MESYFPDGGLISARGESVPVAALTSSIVGIYFSGHWCGPCRRFTPELVRAYDELRQQGRAFEIIFVSSDRDAASFDDYSATMPWLALDYADRAGKARLATQFGCKGIPMLVLVDGSNGRVISTQARKTISEQGAKAWPFGARGFSNDGGGGDGYNNNNGGGGGGGGDDDCGLVLVFKSAEYHLGGARIGVGRDPSSHITTTDGQISTRHAIIDNGVLTDLKSTNGTSVNGKQIAPEVRSCANWIAILCDCSHFMLRLCACTNYLTVARSPRHAQLCTAGGVHFESRRRGRLRILARRQD
jgi:thiol-disulfide isomerase/thioredoxin